MWVGDALVGEGEAYRSPDPQQEAYAIELVEGWNRILIKVGCEQGAWGLYARVSAEDGAEKARAAGVSSYLVKQFSPLQLLDEVESLLCLDYEP